MTWLVEHGVETLICVDGAEPDIEAANKAGLRVLHLPCTYDTVPEEVTMAIARAAEEARVRGKRVATHCHHGRHRSPAAAATAMRALGATQESALAVLERAGTSPGYPGLWAAVREQSAYDKDTRKQMASLILVWNGTVPPAKFVDLMGQMEDRMDALAAALPFADTSAHSNAAAEVGALADLCRLAAIEAANREERMVAEFTALGAKAQALENTLAAAGAPTDAHSASAQERSAAVSTAREQLAAIKADCAACHHRARNLAKPTRDASGKEGK